MYKTTEQQRMQARRWQKENPFRFMWLAARRRAEAKGVPFSITTEDVAASWPADGKCPVFGFSMVPPGASRGTSKQGPREDSASLDRISPSLGYVPGNIAVISWKANRIKGYAAEKDLLAVAKWLSLRDLI